MPEYGIGIVVCRQASDRRLPGYVLGIACKICGKELHISPFGLAAVEQGCTAMCNECGFAVGKRRFVSSVARAGLVADFENYALIRPLLLELRKKYPKYKPSDAVKREIAERPKPCILIVLEDGERA
jgi:hypothetical protein